jgi:hypothetical protein
VRWLAKKIFTRQFDRGKGAILKTSSPRGSLLRLVLQSRVSRTRVIRKTIALTLGLVLWLSGCRKTPEPTPEPKPQEKSEIQSFVSPTAEQAYRLQDDC